MLLNQSSGGYANNDGGASGFNLHRYIDSSNPNSMVQAGAGYMRNTTTIGIPVSTAGNAIAPTAQDVSLKYCLPLMTGLFNLDKYLPLLMCQSGIDVDIFLEDAGNCGAVNVPLIPLAAGPPTVANAWGSSELQYEVSNVEYVATWINLDADFNMRLKSIIDQTGALQLSGTTFRHMQNAIDGLSGQKSITMPIRVKSIKSIFTLFEPTCAAETRMASNIQASLRGLGSIAANGSAGGRFVLTNNSCMDITSWQFRIGSTVYPAKPVQVCAAGKTGTAQAALEATEAHSEVSKALGKLGDYQHEISYSNGNFYKPVTDESALVVTANAPLGPRSGQAIPCFAVGYDFESFQKATFRICVRFCRMCWNWGVLFY